MVGIDAERGNTMIEFLTSNLALSSAIALSAGWGGATLFHQLKTKHAAVSVDETVEHLGEGYYRSSIDGKQLSGNPALVRLNGYDNEEQFLASVGDISKEWYVDPNRRGEFQRLLAEHGQVTEFVSEIYRHKTRERIWISENARIVHDAFGRPSHYEGTIRECTDTMRRLELEERHARLEQYLPGVLMQLDWDPETRMFTMPFATANFERLFKVKAEQLRDDATVLYDYLHPDDVEAYKQTSRAAAREMTVWDLVFRVIRPDGSEVTVQMWAMPERKEDGCFTWHGFLMDVTERERVAKQAHH
ncbi:MAG: PAS domain-containing protein, partial [Pseudomonadota bacterium]